VAGGELVKLITCAASGAIVGDTCGGTIGVVDVAATVIVKSLEIVAAA
jgi:hypothetical protein